LFQISSTSRRVVLSAKPECVDAVSAGIGHTDREFHIPNLAPWVPGSVDLV
jgi:hypothetical protein